MANRHSAACHRAAGRRAYSFARATSRAIIVAAGWRVVASRWHCRTMTETHGGAGEANALASAEHRHHRPSNAPSRRVGDRALRRPWREMRGNSCCHKASTRAKPTATYMSVERARRRPISIIKAGALERKHNFREILRVMRSEICRP